MKSAFQVFTLLVIGTVFAAASGARADALRGFILKSGGASYLQVQTENGKSQRLAIAAQSAIVDTSIKRLKSGDYLVARGAVLPETNSVQIEAIESLGLQALVGAWSTSRLEVYEFKDFSRLNLYVPNSDRKGHPIVKAGEFQYAITPDQGSKYSIFLSSSKDLMVGSIEFRKSRLMLKVVDPKTGEVSAELSLSPLAGSKKIQ